jgi:hypothetical protein
MSLTKVSYSMISGAPANVLDFGAVGNGVADDSVAIQAALNSGAREVVIPSICLITAKLTINASIKVTGPGGLKRNTVGPGSPSSVGAGAVFEINADNVEINGVRFIGSQAGSTITTVNYADAVIWVPGVNSTDPLYNIKVLNCYMDGFAGIAVDIRYTENAQVENNTILNCGYAAIIYESVINGNVTNNIIDNIGAGSGAVNYYGISLSRDPNGTLVTDLPTTNVIVSGNQVSNVFDWTGLDCHAAYKCQYVNNVVTGCPIGINIQYDATSGTSPSPAKDILVDGNIIYGHATLNKNRAGIISLGIFPTDPNENITITNNILVGCGTWGGGGAPVAGSIGLLDTKFGVVTNNTIEKSIRFGISILNVTTDCLIEGNTVNGVIAGAAVGIYLPTVLTDLARVKIANNNFTNQTGDSNYDGTYGISYQGTSSTTVFSQNRMPAALTGKLYRASDGTTNVYTDLSWELEEESIYYPFVAAGGAPTESAGNLASQFRRLPNTTGTYILSAFAATTNAAVGATPTGSPPTSITLTKYDGTNISGGTYNISFSLRGVYWSN